MEKINHLISSRLSITLAELDGLTMAEYCYKSADDFYYLSESAPAILFVVHGSYRLIANKDEFVCDGGEVIFITPEKPYPMQYPAEGAKIFSFTASDAWCTRHGVDFVDLSTQKYSKGSLLCMLMCELYREYLRNDKIAPLAILGLFLSILAELKRRGPKPYPQNPEWVEKLKTILVPENACILSLQYLAEQTGKSASYISKQFPKYFHCKAVDYIRKIKAEQAAILLADKKLSLPYIADECGYCSESYFNQEFQKYFAVTPLNYRNSIP